MSSHRQVHLERTSTGNYLATNDAGVTLPVGTDEGAFSPVELLLAAIGACSAIDVDVVTSRRGEPEEFTVVVGAEKITDESGGARLADVTIDFRVLFGDDEPGRQASGLVPRLVRISHERDCTVSRTVELPTRVTSLVDGEPV